MVIPSQQKQLCVGTSSVSQKSFSAREDDGTWTAVSTLLDESFLSGVEVAAGAGSLKTTT